MQPAVPLWKVIVGVMPTNSNRARKGPVFSMRRGARHGEILTSATAVEDTVRDQRSASHPQPLLLQPAVQARHILAVAVVQQRRAAFLRGDILLGRLAPA